LNLEMVAHLPLNSTWIWAVWASRVSTSVIPRGTPRQPSPCPGRLFWSVRPN